MKIDSNIIKAIDKYLTENDLMAMDLAASLGVSPATMTKWRKVGNGITDQKWDALFPLIKKYLPADRIFINDAGISQYSSAVQKETATLVPALIPLFSLNMIVEYDNTLESAMQFGKRKKTTMSEYRAKHTNKTGIFAVTIDNDNFAPILPAGSTIFSCTSAPPEDGNVVIAKTTDNQIIIGRYGITSKNFKVSTLDGKSIILSGIIAEARSMIQWIFPVLYYEVVTF